MEIGVQICIFHNGDCILRTVYKCNCEEEIIDRNLARAFYFMEAATQSCHAAAMNMILIILLLLILLGGGGFYIGGPAVGGSGLGLILLIVIIIYLMGGFRGRK